MAYAQIGVTEHRKGAGKEIRNLIFRGRKTAEKLVCSLPRKKRVVRWKQGKNGKKYARISKMDLLEMEMRRVTHSKFPARYRVIILTLG